MFAGLDVELHNIAPPDVISDFVKMLKRTVASDPDELTRENAAQALDNLEAIQYKRLEIASKTRSLIEEL